jgi:hypothetical protein
MYKKTDLLLPKKALSRTRAVIDRLFSARSAAGQLFLRSDISFLKAVLGNNTLYFHRNCISLFPQPAMFRNIVIFTFVFAE